MTEALLARVRAAGWRLYLVHETPAGRFRVTLLRAGVEHTATGDTLCGALQDVLDRVAPRPESAALDNSALAMSLL